MVICRVCKNNIEDPETRINPNDPESKGVFNEVDTEIYCPICRKWTWAGEAWQWKDSELYQRDEINKLADEAPGVLPVEEKMVRMKFKVLRDDEEHGL